MTKTSIKPTKTKLPDTTASGDTFIITRGGIKYTPHAGETVTFSGEPTWAHMQRSLRLQYLAKLGAEMMSKEEAEEMLGMADLVVADLATHIISWTWTDAHDVPLPSPPTPDVLLDLPALELVWIFGAYATASTDE